MEFTIAQEHFVLRQSSCGANFGARLQLGLPEDPK
jgi:hypothetical protein